MKSVIVVLLFMLIGTVWAASVTEADDQARGAAIVDASQATLSPEQALDFFDSFEAYVANTPLCVQTTNWVTWTNSPGSAEDAMVSNAQANTGSNSVVFIQNNDVVRLHNSTPITTGVWKLSWQMYIPNGKAGYFNTLALFDPPGHVNTTWAMQAYFNVGGGGTLDAGGASAAVFTYPYDTWIPVEVIVDLDNDQAEFWLNGTHIYTWQYTMGTFGTPIPKQLHANDFFGATASDEMYIDDYTVEEIIPDLLFSDSFDGYAAGMQLVLQNPVFWDTWSGGGGSGEDPVVSDSFAASAANSVVITQNNDLVKTFGSLTTGKYEIGFKIYVPTGKAGYFNTLAGFTPNPFNWGMEVYFDVGGGGRVFGGSATPVAFSYDNDLWQDVNVIVDLDLDSAEFWFEGALIHAWQWTAGASGGGSPLRLDANDFFGATANDEMYFDDYYIMALPSTLPPQIGVNPTSITDSVEVGDSLDFSIQISNNAATGAGSLDWSASLGSSKTNIVSSNVWQNIDKDAVAGEHTGINTVTGPQSNPVGADQDVQLILDDGSRENALGLTNGGQFLWLNRFTPAPTDFPFVLEEVHILFGAAVGINVGELVDIYIYEDTDGDGNPGTGANFLGSLENAAVQFVDDVNFSVYQITPVALNGPGDVLIAVVNRTAGTDPGEFVAAMDQTPPSQNRSWIGTYTAGNPPNPPTLPATDLWGIVDSFGFAGNWMVRGLGSSVSSPIVLLPPTSGSIDPGDSQTLNVRAYGLVADTTYTANIEIASNDPVTPLVTIPVQITVTDVVSVRIPGQAPTTYAISQNYPNPFNPTTTISYQVPQTSDVKLEIYNVLGQKVRTLINRSVEAGSHQVIWDGRNSFGEQVASGVYIYKFEAGQFSKTMKMMMLK